MSKLLVEEVTEEAPGNLFRFVTSLVAKVLSSRPARPECDNGYCIRCIATLHIIAR